MAQLTWAQTAQYNIRALLRMLVAGVGPDGSTAGSGASSGSSSANLQITSATDTGGTDFDPVGRGSTSVPQNVELQDSTKTAFLTDGNPGYVVQKRASDASTDNMALGAAVDAPACSIYYTAALNATKVALKAATGRVLYWHFDNTANAAKTYIQVWNVASGSVTVGTTAPTFVLCVPASSVLDTPLPVSADFDTAITIAATTTAAGSTNPSTAIGATVFYK